MAAGHQKPSDRQFVLEKLRGLNQRLKYNNDESEFDDLVGWIHQRAGELQRVNGIERLQRIDGVAIMSIKQTFDSRKNVIVQTTVGVYQYTEDEILNRPPTYILTPTVLPEEDTMAEALLAYTIGSGTNGGTYTVASTWQDAPLNQIIHQRNADGTAAAFVTALAGNVFTLAAGKYRIEAESQAARTGAALFKARLFNVSTVLPAWNTLQNEESNSIQIAANMTGTAKIRGYLDLGGATQLKLQHWMDNASVNIGFGFPVSTGKPEVYRWIKILKTA